MSELRRNRSEPWDTSDFVEAHYDDLYRFLRHLTRHVQESEDLAQQTLIRAFKSRHVFDGRCSMRTWLHRIAYREYLNWRRGRRLLLALDPHRGSRDPRMQAVLDSETLLWALHKLPQKLAATFLLLEVQELSQAETALVLGTSIGTVKSRHHEARQRLRVLLGDETTEVIHAYETL